jgi:hypothetical protein
MAELETALRQLGGEVAFPPTPDLASAIRGGLERPPVWRRPAAIALAVALVAAIAAVLAVPQSRSAILDWLGLRNLSVVRVDTLPRVPATGRLGLGREVTLNEARRRAPWALVPDSKPDSVYVSESLPGGRVSLLWGTPANVRLLLTEFSGQSYIEKVVESDAKVERAQVGNGGAWFQGPHIVMFQDRNGNFRESRARLAGSTLVWQIRDVTLRLEGRLTKDEALRIARTVS